MIKKTDKFISAPALFVLLAYFAVFAVINFRGIFTFCDGDMYSDMLVGRLMWEQKTLFPDGWVFGNQYYVIATPVLCALFYGITGSMNLSLPLATTVMSVLIIISFYYMLRPFVSDKAFVAVGLLAFTASVIAPNALREAVGQLFFTMASYYACYLITLLIVFGDYVRATQDDLPLRLPFVLSLVLCFCTGMQSMRQMLIMVLPILTLEMLLMLWRVFLKKKVFRKGSFIRAAAYAAANLSGYLLMKALNIASVTIYGNVSIENERSISERIIMLWHAISSVTGLNYSRNPEFSRLSWLPVLLFSLSVLAAFVLILRRVKEEPSPLACIWLLCAISIAGVFAAGLLLNINVRDIYIFVWYLLVAVSVILLLEAMPIVPKRVYALILSLTALWNLNFSYGENLRKSLEAPNADIAAFNEYCRENDIHYVYCKWGAVPYVLPSDGDIIAGFYDDLTFQIIPYINLQNIYTEKENAEAVYLTPDYNRDFTISYFSELPPEVTEVGSFGQNTAFISDMQLMHR